MSYINEIATALFKANCIKFGDFILTSGIRSPIYVDLRALLSHPKEFKLIIEKSIQVVRELNFDFICGIESSGIPLTTALSLELEVPMVYVRKKVKGHGLMKAIEGEPKKNCKVLIVDDVVTTGGSIARAVETLKSEDLAVSDAYVIVDREQGAKEKLASMGIELKSLTTLTELVSTLGDIGLIDNGTVAKVLEYLVSYHVKG